MIGMAVVGISLLCVSSSGESKVSLQGFSLPWHGRCSPLDGFCRSGKGLQIFRLRDLGLFSLEKAVGDRILAVQEPAGKMGREDLQGMEGQDMASK